MTRDQRWIDALALFVWVGICGWGLTLDGGSARECTTASDCLVEEPACRVVESCVAGRCAYQDAPAGMRLPRERQTVGDCQEWVCDGAGKAKLIGVVTDADDGNPCTADRCNGSSAEYALQVDVPCYSGPPGTIGVGVCVGGIQQCDAGGKAVGTCVGETLPADLDGCDVRDGIDDDCDGTADEDCHCGDGKLTPEIGEECDDWGTADGDTCSPTCKQQRVLAITAGSTHTCALLSRGVVKCWGGNLGGMLGVGDKNDRGDQPKEMGNALPAIDLGRGRWAVALASGRYHNCAILDDETIKCWGTNAIGELGLGDTSNRGMVPSEMGDGLASVSLGADMAPIAVFAGRAETCVQFIDGSMKCWGANDRGQLGLEDRANRGGAKVEMGAALGFVKVGAIGFGKTIAIGSKHTCVLSGAGGVKCWGNNEAGQLGFGDTKIRGDKPGDMEDGLSFISLGNGEMPVALSSFHAHSCALFLDGSAKCWGANAEGALGLGDVNARGDAPGEMGDVLAKIDLGHDVSITQISAGGSHTCALASNGRVKCWGCGGTLGLGDRNSRGVKAGEMGDNLPYVDLGPAAIAVSIATGYAHTCALLEDGSVKCWGRNDFGQLGLGDTNARGDEPNEMGDNLPRVKLFSDEW